MLNKHYSQLKSGTDIRGIASDGVKGEEINLNDETVFNIGIGFALWLGKKVNKDIDNLTISIGIDSRISGERLGSVFKNALKKYGVTVYYCGLASTPSMFMTTIDLKCDGAVEITASHHPFNRNGFKFFTKDGGLESEDIESILKYAQEEVRPQDSNNGIIKRVDYISEYSERLCTLVKEEVNSKENYNMPLEGFKIVVDAGNGAGGFYVDKVLQPLGADTKGSRFLEPDGMFPNHVPNPEDSKAMDSIVEAVKESNADLGIIFDTDVDRGGAVDDKGNEINRNRLVALASVIALEGNEGGTIVTDSITSSGLKEFIEEDLKGVHYRYRRGYKNVINKAIELNNKGINCPLAIETSGHAAMKENYFLDDGAYLCTKILIKMAQLKNKGENLDSLTKSLKEPIEDKEIRIKILDKEFKKYGNKIIENLTEYANNQKGWTIAEDNREGIRVSFDKENGNGWFLLRLSVHDPIMPLNIESDSKGGVDLILNKLNVFLKDQKGLNW